MKDIREQILKILLDKIKCSGYTAIEGIPQSTREIESLIKENYVEKEFMEWYIKGDHNFATVFNSNPPQFTNFTEGSKHKYSLDELYDYWLKKIKK